MRKTKSFDIQIYELEQKAKTFLLILIVFILSFLLGYWCKNVDYEEVIRLQKIKIIDLKDQVDRAIYQNKN